MHLLFVVFFNKITFIKQEVEYPVKVNVYKMFIKNLISVFGLRKDCNSNNNKI